MGNTQGKMAQAERPRDGDTGGWVTQVGGDRQADGRKAHNLGNTVQQDFPGEVQWLRLYPSIAGGASLIPGQGTKTSQDEGHSQKEKRTAEAHSTQGVPCCGA